MFFANVIIFIVNPRQIKEIFPLFLYFVTKRNNLQQNPSKTVGFTHYHIIIKLFARNYEISA